MNIVGDGCGARRRAPLRIGVAATIAMCSWCAVAGAPTATAATTATFLPAPPQLDGLFGFSVALDGTRMVIGAPSSHDPVSGEDGNGQIGIYDRLPDGTYTTTYVTAVGSSLSTIFGFSVALDGDRIVGITLGEDGAGASVVVLDRRPDGSWAQTKMPLVGDRQVHMEPGLAFSGPHIAIEGDRFVIGTPDLGPGVADDSDLKPSFRDPDLPTGGAAIVFDRRADGSWTQTLLTRAGGRPGDRFGASVAIEGDRIVVGAPRDSDTVDDAGSVTVFERDARGSWAQTRLTGSDRRDHDLLGAAVAIDGDRVVAASPGRFLRNNAGVFGQAMYGTVTVFERVASGDYEDTTLYPPYCNQPQAAVAADAGRIVVTGCTPGPSIFERRSDGTFGQRILANPMPPEYRPESLFRSVAIDGDTVLAGYPRTDTPGRIGTSTGVTALYELTPGGPCSTATNPFTAGDDVIVGTPGDDVLRGGLGNDVIDGGGGRDVICGEAGNDELHGGDGDDFLYGDAGDDRVFGEFGDDRIVGADGDDVLDGGLGDDWILGGSGNDRIALGDDTSDCCAVLEWARGGSGDDVIVASGGKSADIGGGPGDDELYGGAQPDLIRGGPGDDVISGGDEASGDPGDHLEGNEGNDRIAGGAGGDFIFGNGGDDVIDGGPGDDQVYGGSGVDSASGGPGDDVVDVRDGSPGDVADGGENTDRCPADSGDVVTTCELP